MHQKVVTFTRSSYSSSQARGPVTFLSLGITAVIGGAILVYYNIEKETKIKRTTTEVVTTGKAALGGPFVLVDQDGRTVTDASFKGRYSLLYFGFTYCPDICPSELVKIGKIMDMLGIYRYMFPVFTVVSCH